MNQCVPFAAFVSMWSGRLEELDSAEEYPLEKNNQGYLLSSLLHFPVIKQLCQHRTTGWGDRHETQGLSQQQRHLLLVLMYPPGNCSACHAHSNLPVTYSIFILLSLSEVLLLSFCFSTSNYSMCNPPLSTSTSIAFCRGKSSSTCSGKSPEVTILPSGEWHQWCHSCCQTFLHCLDPPAKQISHKTQLNIANPAFIFLSERYHKDIWKLTPMIIKHLSDTGQRSTSSAGSTCRLPMRCPCRGSRREALKTSWMKHPSQSPVPCNTWVLHAEGSLHE